MGAWHDYPLDEGCGGLCVRCTECPYPVCRLDQSVRINGYGTEADIAARHAEMRRLRAEGRSLSEIAKMVHASTKTVSAVTAAVR